jgi:hypothetical protein
MSVRLIDTVGNAVSEIDFGEAYINCPTSIRRNKFALVNHNDMAAVISVKTSSQCESDDSLIMVKLLSGDVEEAELQIFVDLPQQQLVVPPNSQLEITIMVSCINDSTGIPLKKPMHTNFTRASSLVIIHWQLEDSTYFSEILFSAFVRLCVSVMEVDEADIEFDSCLVGNIYVRDIQIWNRSECDLYYRISPVNPLQSLPVTFADFETGRDLVVTESIHISAYSSQRIRVTLNAKVLNIYILGQ